MRALPFLALASLALGACDPPEPTPDGGSDEPAWSGGPAGHVYVYSGPLYDIDARDGRILRKVVLDHAIANLWATSDHAYFTKFDTDGKGRVFQLGLETDVPAQLGDVSNTIFGMAGGQLIGVRNASEIVRTDIASGAVTTTAIPGGLSCESGSIAGHTLYLACVHITLTTDAGMIALDLDANTFGAFIVVKPGVMPISMASNVTATPAGVVFVLYEGGASMGTRTAYAIDVAGGTVGAPILLPGASDDLDEQDAIGNTIYLTMFPAGQVLPFDVATMTARSPIAVERPRHLRAGGGMLWVAAHGLDGGLARIDPTSATVALRTFPPLESSAIDALAFGAE